MKPATATLKSAVFHAYGPPITLSLAKRISQEAEHYAQQNGWAVAIVIVDCSGHIVQACRLDQTQYGSYEVAVSKALTASQFRRATWQFEEAVNHGRLRLLSMSNLLPMQGGYPITVNECVIGAIGISGASAEQDSEIAEAALNILKANDPST